MGEIKVTDKRMFTPDGRLREEFERELERARAEDAESPEPAAPAAPAEPVPAPSAPPAPAAAAPTDTAAPAFTLPGDGPAQPPTGLLELIQILGDLTAACLGQAPLPNGRLALDLDGARFYIDLIGALIGRFGSAFPPQDRRALDGFLDQLRLQYVARRG